MSKKKLFKIHSWIGTKLSILFFIVCFSGTMATLSHEMDWLFISEIRAKPQKEFASRNEILSNLKKEYPKGQVSYWMRTEEPYLCDIIYVTDKGRLTYVFANPYTGEIQGNANLTFQRFFRDLHYFLFMPFYQFGYLIVLSFAFLLLVSFLTALFFYKKWWRKLFVLETKKGPLVFFRSLHRLVGLWSVPFSILFSVTGIWYFVERTNIANVRTKVNPKLPKLEHIAMDADSIDLAYDIDYEKVAKVAQNAIPYFTAEDMNIPNDHRSPVYVRGNSDVPLVRQRANRVYINPYNYEVVGIQNARKISNTMWVNDIADPLHFGYWGGLTTKIIWFFMGLGISSLVLTGIWITLKRKALQRKKQHKPILGKWKFVNWGIYLFMMISMYVQLVGRYHTSITGIMVISCGWLIFLGLAYYVFAHRLNKLVKAH
ncbi:PepSY-associated TM helix domain-containing protein [Flagellimonas crocea]|uniref:PepSY-associated TM helix domain-containing protein n=1 Tax=Flagellimonas crocea TaxID=3067311 RepID=UPI00296F55D6|nr:PepSY-associated TM helix domain-containing protein [Muricauda sp. DH64]